ncbi:hypothetical protein PENSPDRAFT_694154 [Peniophora sp. CONT]|nr:hypothetical protein PENSPDRAFT_694154 [Peniophora sp. CONT]
MKDKTHRDGSPFKGRIFAKPGYAPSKANARSDIEYWPIGGASGALYASSSSSKSLADYEEDRYGTERTHNEDDEEREDLRFDALTLEDEDETEITYQSYVRNDGPLQDEDFGDTDKEDREAMNSVASDQGHGNGLSH